MPKISGDFVNLEESESNHCIRVLRMNKGSIIQLVDGNGGFFEAEIADPNPKKCRLQIIRSVQNFGKREFYIHIAIAPTKNMERFEWFAEKTTEIGIDEITPLICSESERRMLKTGRIEKILISAMKQSLKAYLPKINPCVRFDEFILFPFNGKKFIAHCINDQKSHMKNLVREKDNVLILIGPEGDFTESEIEQAAKNGFIGVSLGESRLRTETAGIIACHIVNLCNA